MRARRSARAARAATYSRWRRARGCSGDESTPRAEGGGRRRAGVAGRLRGGGGRGGRRRGVAGGAGVGWVVVFGVARAADYDGRYAGVITCDVSKATHSRPCAATVSREEPVAEGTSREAGPTGPRRPR